MATHMFLERDFSPPIDAADVLARFEQGAWCFDMYCVQWRGSFLSTDGARMVCWFEAPDAESIRSALDKGGADTRRLWIGTVHDGPAPVVPNVLVERSFDEPVRVEDIQAIEDAKAWCLQAHRVKFARTFFAHDRKRMLLPVPGARCRIGAPGSAQRRHADGHGVGIRPRQRTFACSTLALTIPRGFPRWVQHRARTVLPVPGHRGSFHTTRENSNERQHRSR